VKAVPEQVVGVSGPRGKRKSLRSEELNYLCLSPHTIQAIKSRRMRLVGHVAVWRRREVHTECWRGIEENNTTFKT